MQGVSHLAEEGKTATGKTVTPAACLRERRKMKFDYCVPHLGRLHVIATKATAANDLVIYVVDCYLFPKRCLPPFLEI